MRSEPINQISIEPASTDLTKAQFSLSLRARAYYHLRADKKDIYTTLLSFRKINVLPEELIVHIFEQGVPTSFIPNWKSFLKKLDSEDPHLEIKLRTYLGAHYNKEVKAVKHLPAHFLADGVKPEYFTKQFGKTIAQQILGIINHLNMLPTEALSAKALKFSMHPKFVEAWALTENFSINNESYLFFPNLELYYLPDNLKKCTKLKGLSTLNNHLTTLPREIDRLVILESLSFLNNQLSRLPDELTSLHTLKHLNLARNELTALPKSFSELKNKTQVNIDAFVKIPDGCGHLDIYVCKTTTPSKK